MKSKSPDIAIVRRIGRRKSRVKLGLRIFLFFMALALLLGAAGIALNLKYEETLRREPANPD